MNDSEALQIIELLADGIDPATGEIFPDSSPYQNAQVIRALYAAKMALKRTKKYQEWKQNLPANAGKAWTTQEDEQLALEYRAGKKSDEIAAMHQRTRGAIESRLILKGLLEI